MRTVRSGREHREVASDDLAGLLSRCAAGDDRAWRTLVDMYSRRVFALARSRCRNVDVAEEITQSVFATLAAAMATGDYVERGRFESWLFRIAMNRVRDLVRKSRRSPEQSDPDIVNERPAPSEARGPSGMLDRLRDAMDELGDADREVIELRHHGQMSFKQMADALNEPMGTLLARHHRALRKLKELLEARGVTADAAGFFG